MNEIGENEEMHNMIFLVSDYEIGAIGSGMERGDDDVPLLNISLIEEALDIVINIKNIFNLIFYNE